MATIGTFTKSGDRYTGTITTLMLQEKVTLVPVEKTKDSAPDYRVYANNAEIGAAWNTTAKSGSHYLSVQLDDPSFPAPIACRLVDTKDGLMLIWSR